MVKFFLSITRIYISIKFLKSIIDSIAGNGYYDELAYRMYENQQEFVKGYNNNWTNSNYNRTADELDVFLNALD